MHIAKSIFIYLDFLITGKLGSTFKEILTVILLRFFSILNLLPASPTTISEWMIEYYFCTFDDLSVWVSRVIILLFQFRITQHIVGLIDYCKILMYLIVLVARTHLIRMVQQCQLIVRLLDLLGTARVFDAQYLVVVLRLMLQELIPPKPLVFFLFFV